MKQKLLPFLLIICYHITNGQSVTILPGNSNSGNIISNSGTFPTLNIFPSGTTNADKMVISHSPNYPSWGLQYRDLGDKFVFMGGEITTKPTFTTDLTNTRVGVGIDNPSHTMDILGGSWSLGNPNQGDFRIGDPTYNFRIGVATGGGGAGDIRQFATGGTNRLIWGTNALDRMALNSSGYLGIGTIDPETKLHVKGGDIKINDSFPFLYFTPTDIGANSGIRFNDQTTPASPAGYMIYNYSQSAFKIFHGENSSSGLNLDINHKLGLGLDVPAGKMHIKYNSGTGNPHLMLEEASSTDGGRITFKNAGTTKFWDLWGYPDPTNANANFNIYYSGLGNILSIQGNGNVGIGTTTPDNKLDVLGVIRANEIIVETGWADYVFENNYALKDLNEVEKYINENKHLPNVPSAKEIQEKGAHVAELMTKMMAKIEELTLYTIKQQKEIDELKTLLK
jgi:hypothetical protein